MVNIKSIENGIAAQPFIPGDAAIAIHVIEHEDLLNRMAEGLTSLEFRKAMGQHAFQGFDGFAEALDAFPEFVCGHPIRGHEGVELFLLHMNLRFAVGGIGRIEFAVQCGLTGAQLIKQLR